ncbi:hypothetical protein STEG23_028260, partial [Scotinomys teguina]
YLDGDREMGAGKGKCWKSELMNCKRVRTRAISRRKVPMWYLLCAPTKILAHLDKLSMSPNMTKFHQASVDKNTSVGSPEKTGFCFVALTGLDWPDFAM